LDVVKEIRLSNRVSIK